MPLKVTARLLEPIAGIDPPHLDSILECVMRPLVPSILKSSNGNRHIGADAMRTGTIPIPIDRKFVAGYPHPIARCSSPIMGHVHRDGVEHFARRLDTSDPHLLAEENRKQVNHTGGEFKASRLPLRVRVVNEIVWFCMGRGSNSARGKGGASEMRNRLKRVDCIGKKSSYGYGRVAEWIVEPAQDDWSWFAPTDDGPMLMRTLPSCVAMPKGLWGFRPSFAAPVSPYFDPALLCEVITPC
ncbi:MAG TPA: hypothetical protein VGM05_22105 [Planctomycetaceae bacterium]|jgi:hypothetical protein